MVFSRLSSVPDRETRTSAITRRALSYVAEKGFTSVALYLSVRDELSTKELFNELLTRNVSLSVPVVTSDGQMVFSRVTKDTAYRKGAFGIPEPVNVVETNTFDVMFVPLVAFDENNNRLGHGKGYYDRYFAEKISPSTKKIGLAFLEQKVPCVPCETNDVRLDDVFYI